jgi:hypothetical protein
MARLFSYLTLTLVKALSGLLYRFEVNWINQPSPPNWKDIKLIVFLNHTSLFEPIFVRVAPQSLIWRLSKNLVAPGADITLKRPIVGRFFRWIAPGLVAISRKRDKSWKKFMHSITSESIVTILPEGRMMRKNGLDKHGKPMSVRGGIADILDRLQKGSALFVYSGGLHHIQSPGQRLPKIFKRVKVNLELMNIEKYKDSLKKYASTDKEFRRNVVADLNLKLTSCLPKTKG